jgi:hypothetical protein
MGPSRRDYFVGFHSRASRMAVATVIEATLGSADIPEVAITMPSAPGVTHRYT